MESKNSWIVKGIIGIVLVSSIASCAFLGGMLFHANVYASINSAPSLTSLSFTPTGSQTQSIGRATSVEDVQFATFWEAWQFINEEFYGDIPTDEERMYGAIRGMVNSLGDQHTAFIDPVRSAINNENMGGSFEGIGASIRLNENGQLEIADPFPDRPAFLAGLRPGDLILQVDGESTDGLGLYDAVLKIRGPADSAVVLTIYREGELEAREVEIVRAKIEIEVVTGELLEGNIAHIRLTQFSNGASDKILAEWQSLRQQGATKMVLDLRSNPGGLLSEAVDVSSLFVEGTIVIERFKGAEEKLFTSADSHHEALNIPLVVLVNGGSASASEIVAGAVQDKEQGTIIGQQTFGKGSVQIPHRLKDGSELRVTIAEWLTPKARQIHQEGVTPDVTVEMTFEQFEQGLDPQLDKAVEYLRIQ